MHAAFEAHKTCNQHDGPQKSACYMKQSWGRSSTTNISKIKVGDTIYISCKSKCIGRAVVTKAFYQSDSTESDEFVNMKSDKAKKDHVERNENKMYCELHVLETFADGHQMPLRGNQNTFCNPKNAFWKENDDSKTSENREELNSDSSLHLIEDSDISTDELNETDGSSESEFVWKRLVNTPTSSTKQQETNCNPNECLRKSDTDSTRTTSNTDTTGKTSNTKSNNCTKEDLPLPSTSQTYSASEFPASTARMPRQESGRATFSTVNNDGIPLNVIHAVETDVDASNLAQMLRGSRSEDASYERSDSSDSDDDDVVLQSLMRNHSLNDSSDLDILND